MDSGAMMEVNLYQPVDAFQISNAPLINFGWGEGLIFHFLGPRWKEPKQGKDYSRKLKPQTLSGYRGPDGFSWNPRFH